MNDCTVIYYTSNYLEKNNPYFLKNTKAQLVKAIGNLPLIVVSHFPVDRFEGYEGDYQNIVVGDIGRGHLNIYRQILIGAKAAKTMYVAMAEDDILYSPEHFQFEKWVHDDILGQDIFLYDMAKVSLFTWTNPPIFSFRTKRRVVNQLIAKRDMLVAALEERFDRAKQLMSEGWTEEKLIKYWGDPGRYESILKITSRPTYEYYSWVPSVVFSHEFAYGYEYNQGKRKKHGDLRIVELLDWGKAADVLKFFYEPTK